MSEVDSDFTAPSQADSQLDSSILSAAKMVIYNFKDELFYPIMCRKCSKKKRKKLKLKKKQKKKRREEKGN